MSSNKTIYDYDQAGSIDGATDWLLIQPGNNSVDYNRINRNVFLGVTGQPMDISTSQSVSNKVLGNTNSITIKDNSFTLQDNGDTTKQAVFELSGITTATTRTFTLPNASTTVVGTDATQTLTNKTLTAPVINNGSITGTSITTDAIVGQSSATSGTIYGLSVSSSKVGTNGVVTASITDTAVTPAKLQSGTGSSWSMQSYTPTWTGSTSNPAIGNGTLTGRYIQTGKMVDVEIYLKAGSTTTFGTGYWMFTLPVTSTSNFFVGNAFILDSGSSFFAMFMLNATDATVTAISTTKILGTSFAAGSNLGATVPMTWANGDVLVISYRYEAA